MTNETGRPIRRRSALAGGGTWLVLGRAADAADPHTTDASRPFVLGWREVSPSGVIVLAAEQEGLFAKYGVSVTLRAERTGDPPFASLLASGTLDGAVAPAPLLLDPLRRGLDARFTAGLSGGGLRLLAGRHPRLRHIEDMKGRRIGIANPDGPARLFFSVMLRRKGINPFAEVTWVTVPTSSMDAALGAGTIDAIAVSDPDAFRLMRAGRLTTVATNVSGSYRDRTYAALILRGPCLRGEARVRAAGLTRALLDGARFVATRTAAAADLAGTIAPDLPPEARRAMLGGEAPDRHPTGDALVDDIAAYTDELRLLGTMPFELNAGRFARGVCDDVLKT